MITANVPTWVGTLLLWVDEMKALIKNKTQELKYNHVQMILTVGPVFPSGPLSPGLPRFP